MNSRFQSLVSWACLPIYVWQGLKVRRQTPRMLPPPHRGWLERSGSGKPFTILLLGDSSAAGVGADHINESLAGHLADALAERTGRPVSIRIAGKNSATSGQIRDHVVPHLERRDWDYICLNIGTNDAKNFHSARRFRREFGTLLYALKSRYPASAIIWAGVLDLSKVPALPSPLNHILGIRSRLIDSSGKMLCQERGAFAPVSDWKTVRENFSTDGFHASSLGYREWAQGLADFILSLEKEAKA